MEKIEEEMNESHRALLAVAHAQVTALEPWVTVLETQVTALESQLTAHAQVTVLEPQVTALERGGDERLAPRPPGGGPRSGDCLRADCLRIRPCCQRLRQSHGCT